MRYFTKTIVGIHQSFKYLMQSQDIYLDNYLCYLTLKKYIELFASHFAITGTCLSLVISDLICSILRSNIILCSKAFYRLI